MRFWAIALILINSPLWSKATESCVTDWHQYPPMRVQPGDLVFRHGHGLWTRLFINRSTREKRFSHVGMIVSTASNAVQIIHSEANDFTGVGSVRLQFWPEFFKDSSECAVFRYDGTAEDIEKIVRKAEDRIGISFDPLFNMDNTNRLYCTEFIRESVNDAVQTNLIGWTESSAGRIVAIDDIYRKKFIRIFDSKRPSERK